MFVMQLRLSFQTLDVAICLSFLLEKGRQWLHLGNQTWQWENHPWIFPLPRLITRGYQTSSNIFKPFKPVFARGATNSIRTYQNIYSIKIIQNHKAHLQTTIWHAQIESMFFLFPRCHVQSQVSCRSLITSSSNWDLAKSTPELHSMDVPLSGNLFFLRLQLKPSPFFFLFPPVPALHPWMPSGVVRCQLWCHQTYEAIDRKSRAATWNRAAAGTVGFGAIWGSKKPGTMDLSPTIQKHKKQFKNKNIILTILYIYTIRILYMYILLLSLLLLSLLLSLLLL